MKEKVHSQKKGKSIWLAKDLTIRQSNLAYIAQQAVMKGHAHSTWINEGKIFLKKGQKMEN